MEYSAKSRNVRYSPYKLRPVVDVIRGKKAVDALNWLLSYKTQRAVDVRKLLLSALANAKSRDNVLSSTLFIKDIRVDQGPMHKYFKPAAQGRAAVQRKRLCHISIVLGRLDKPKEA
jgi:large subunit ribosomal protein L22